MIRILKYLKSSMAAVIAIVLLLMVQAYCDLSLPQYMSDIVDIGIQQGGIELPEKDASIDSQRALLELREQYQAEGVDLGKLQTDYLLKKGSAMLGLSLVMVLAAVLVGLLAARTAAKVGMELRSNVYKKVISFSGSELDRFSSASLITRTTNDIQQVQMVSVMLLRMVAYAPILGLGGIVKVMGTQTGMSWIIVVAVGAIVLLVSVLMGLAMPRFKKMQTLVDKLNLISREIVTGIPVIRAFSREKHEEGRFAEASGDLMKTQLFTNRVMTFMQPCMMLIMNAITVLIIWVGAQGIDMGTLQVGDMMAFISYTMQIVMSFLMLTMVSVMIPRAGVAAGRIDEVLNTENSVNDSAAVRDSELSHPKGTLSFNNVSFRYPDAEEDVLCNISFTAESGQTTAIIGSTGSGKSTLLNLIPRFYDVTGGSITLDGIDIRELSQHKLRSMLGLVPQKGVLFSGTIESNIKYGGEIDDAAMHTAADIAQAAQFIGDKAEGYAAPIAQGGTNVSGGQKQRLSIARAIAKKPALFLFDDSFSALDYKTDSALRHAISQQLADTTVIIVAQRISTILHAERIVVLDEGSVAGVGTHAQLLKNCDAYREIAKSQLSEKELEGGESV